MLDNERCDWREILGAHGQCTMQRMAGLPVVLCLTDTTELDFNGRATTFAAGVRFLRASGDSGSCV